MKLTCIFPVCSLLLVSISLGEDAEPGVSIYDGTVIVNGQVIQPPYEVGIVGDRLTINGLEFVRAELIPRRDASNSVVVGTKEEQIATVERFLLNGGLICSFDFERVAWFDEEQNCEASLALDFISVLLADEISIEDKICDFMTRQILGLEHLGTREWWTLIKSFYPSPELIELACGFDGIDYSGNRGKILNSGNGERAFNNLTHWSSANSVRYMITVCGMLLSVVAFGYLLQHQPVASGGFRERNMCHRAVHTVYVCLTFIILLGIFDLVSTINAAGTSQFLEVNPIGGWLLSSPTAAIAFKIIATGTSVSLLFRFRFYIISQLASWWMCLVSILVVFRWLIFRSMLLG